MVDKVVIIGAGNVGTAIAYALIVRESCREIALIDVNEDHLLGETTDLRHTRMFSSQVVTHKGSFEDCADADIIIFTAGFKRKPDETRIDLLNRNLAILDPIMQNIKKNVKDPENGPIILIVSNPVDSMTYFAQKFSGFPRFRVFGAGTTLDTARLRAEFAEFFNISIKKSNGLVIGEHGENGIMLWELFRVNEQDFSYFDNALNKQSELAKAKKEIEQRVKMAGDIIIQKKGYTNYGIGLGVVRIVEAILKNENTLLPVCFTLQGEYDQSNVALSVPCMLGAQGITKPILMPLNTEDLARFNTSAEKLKKLHSETGK